MNRAERRRSDRKLNKDKIFTYKESELKKAVSDESAKREDHLFKLATKIITISSLIALKKEFKFGEKRLTKFIAQATKIYADVVSSEKSFDNYEDLIKKMGIDIEFLDNEISEVLN